MPAFLSRFLKLSDPSEVTYAHFTQFLAQGVEEHQNLEYKPRGMLVKKDDSIVSSSNPRDLVGYTALARSVASMANAEGGLVVVGVREKLERFKGTVVKIRPGAMTPIPLTVTRESIEANLLAKIQFPIEGITVVPLRRTPRSKGFVYLIDVPQSDRAPHRVNELFYFQRTNFSTSEMRHYQVADLFGKRRVPDLGITASATHANDGHENSLRLVVTMTNRGRAVGRFVTCICQVVGDRYRILRSAWAIANEGATCQWQTGANHVVYPDVSTSTGEIVFVPKEPGNVGPFAVQFSIYAEDMVGRSTGLTIDPSAV